MKLRINIALSNAWKANGWKDEFPDDFVDGHPPNVKDEDFGEFLIHVRGLVPGVNLIMDQSNHPMIYVRLQKDREIIAWFDTEDDIGYRPLHAPARK